MKRIFVYEHLSAGGEMAGDTAQARHAADELLAMGQQMRDAIVLDLLGLENYDVTVATCKRASTVPPAAHAVFARDGETPLDFVARHSLAHDLAWVVAPETDGLLSKFCECVGRERWLGCDGPAIALTTRKRSTLLRLADAGIATPLAFEGAADITRWVVKPDDGAGAVATSLHHTRAAAVNASRHAPASAAMEIEPWVEGEALSLSLLCSRGGTELLSVNRQHLTIDAQGVVSFLGVDVNVMAATDDRIATLRALAERIGRTVSGLRGFVGVDVVWHAQRGPVVIEINPRVTCAYAGLSHSLGRNLAREVIAAHGHGTAPADAQRVVHA
ncbi:MULTISPECIES: ATP-grasp domain-containing protein [unclassified Variovorax]|uniref:ATP-grasp domain-containing protein n=1 Tax=unclassified Variovorax TaxID=663243 RepID=UPI001BD62BBC|nr:MULTISPECIES: ATP-grasp domain-containing protein [unclassified Variovorax]